jgi:uncharacterized repeat protein (TIGR01451 family)
MRLLKGLAAAAAILATSLPGAASAQSTADLSVSVVGSPNPVGQNEDITWTITVKNFGPEQASGVMLEAEYGSDAAPVSATTTQGTCSDTGGIVNYSLGSIAPGAQVTATFVMQTFRGDGDFLGVSVSSHTEDPNLRNNRASATVRVISGSEVSRGARRFICPPVGGVATGGGGTAAGSQAWLATFGLLTMAGLVVAAVMRVRR